MSILSEVQEVLLSIEVIHVVPSPLFLLIKEFHVNISFLLSLRVAEVHKVPFQMLTEVSNILRPVSSSNSVQIRVRIGGEVKDSSCRSAHPHCKSSVSQSSVVLLN